MTYRFELDMNENGYLVEPDDLTVLSDNELATRREAINKGSPAYFLSDGRHVRIWPDDRVTPVRAATKAKLARRKRAVQSLVDQRAAENEEKRKVFAARNEEEDSKIINRRNLTIDTDEEGHRLEPRDLSVLSRTELANRSGTMEWVQSHGYTGLPWYGLDDGRMVITRRENPTTYPPTVAVSREPAPFPEGP